jgi:hypothetical protein
MAEARRTSHGWKADAPQPVPSGSELAALIEIWCRGDRTVLAGFDFPIGVPVTFGVQTGFRDFKDALSKFGGGEWNRFFDVADSPEEISLRRPFYPRTYPKGRRRADLLAALGVGTIDELRRECERKTDNRPAACSLFWTLGGNQVGKAAINGWQNVIRPALAGGARLWPFDGSLDELSKSPGCVLAETYPREAYSHVGVSLGPHQSKRKQDHRRVAMEQLPLLAKKSNVTFTSSAQEAFHDGFGSKDSGEDPFDAFVGLLSMIKVVAGRRPEGGRSLSGEVARWEGWILGQREPRIA